jgi:hypothetical protein
MSDDEAGRVKGHCLTIKILNFVAQIQVMSSRITTL